MFLGPSNEYPAEVVMYACYVEADAVGGFFIAVFEL